MPALQVRDFPDDLYEQLKAYAASQHRSIAQQTIGDIHHRSGARLGQGGPRLQRRDGRAEDGP